MGRPKERPRAWPKPRKGCGQDRDRPSRDTKMSELPPHPRNAPIGRCGVMFAVLIRISLLTFALSTAASAAAVKEGAEAHAAQARDLAIAQATQKEHLASA